MSKRSPSKWTVEALAAYVDHGGCETEIEVNGWKRRAPARPSISLDTLSVRLKLALAVFRGEADAVFWPGQ